MPMDMRSQKNARAVEELCKDPNIRKIAHYGSSKLFLDPPIVRGVLNGFHSRLRIHVAKGLPVP